MKKSKPMTTSQVWKLLKRNDKNVVYQTIDNCLVVLRNDPTLQGAVRQNILTDRQDIVKDVGWVRSSTTITDTDYQYIIYSSILGSNASFFTFVTSFTRSRFQINAYPSLSP